MIPCVWEYKTPIPLRNNGGEATLFWKSDVSLDTPGLQPIQAEGPFSTPETAHFSLPVASWSMLSVLDRPWSRGQLRITGPSASDPIEIVANTLSHPADMKALIRSVELCREIGNSAAMKPFVKREVMPGNLTVARSKASCEMRRQPSGIRPALQRWVAMKCLSLTGGSKFMGSTICA
jgi:choline dehydrogenase